MREDQVCVVERHRQQLGQSVHLLWEIRGESLGWVWVGGWQGLAGPTQV
jgi:hypothetical protein